MPFRLYNTNYIERARNSQGGKRDSLLFIKDQMFFFVVIEV